jgi:hypothetical protein
MAMNEEKLKKHLKIASILVITCCSVLLFPQVRSFIVEIAERVLGRELRDPNKWMRILYEYSLFGILCFGSILISTIQKLQNSYGKYIEKIVIYISISIIAMSVIVRIVMYVKCRSLWLDEAFLAESIVTRNWFELLVPPLGNAQSAPIFYVIVLKLIGSIFGYSEFSLRIFSLFAFIGLLFCETMFLKRVLKYNNYKTAFIIVISALLPSYIWYSNELKPYMSDALFIVLAILLYFYYTEGKIKLHILTVLYILIIGFSSPSIFFIGGILFSEFLSAVFKKDKKQYFFVFISGTIVSVVFCLYYFWWMLPVSEEMKIYHDKPHGILDFIKELRMIFDARVSHSDSSIVMFLVPFAAFGFFSLCKSGNKIAYSVVLSLFLVFLASAIGYWPLTGRLWLFLPAIVLIFTPAGIDFIFNKIKHRKIADAIEYFLFSTILIFLFVNCFGYIGNKMYFIEQEINPLIYYVQRNIKEDEKLYVYPSAKFAFNYKNGYGSTKIGNVAKDNIIYGINRDEWNESVVGNELLSILENKKNYLIFQHYWTGIDSGLTVLKNYGTLTEVMNVYDTPLYYFEKYANTE